MQNTEKTKKMYLARDHVIAVTGSTSHSNSSTVDDDSTKNESSDDSIIHISDNDDDESGVYFTSGVKRTKCSEGIKATKQVNGTFNCFILISSGLSHFKIVLIR